MAELPINYLDTWKVARDKINDSFEALEATVESYRPHIESWVWWIWTTNTWVKAVWDSISMKVEDWYIRYKSSSVTNWTQIIALSDLKWPTGNWIDHLTSSKSWKTTTVVLHYTDWTSDSFTVNDWEDGSDVWYVVWPSSSTNGNVVLFDWTTWKLVKDSGIQLGTAATKNTGTSAGNIPVLDSEWKINTTVLPALAITDTFTVSTSSDLTSLSSAEKWDVAIATSESKTYILSADPYSTAANWKELASPAGWVSSVNSKTWAVTLDADDISDSTTTNKFTNATEKSTWTWKQDKLVAGSNISIASDWKTISATDTTYTATDFDIKDLTDSTGLRTTWSGKQDALTAWTGLSIDQNNEISNSAPFSPSGTATTWYVVTKTAWGYEWAAPSWWDVMVSSQTGNILTTGMKIRAWTESDYSGLWTYDSNCLYLTIPDSTPL